MLTIDMLRSFGASVDEGLERCLNDEEFYLDLIPSALDESYYSSIENSIKSKDFRAAFDAAHALKGLLSNLALDPIFEPVDEMTEALRAWQDIDYRPYLTTMWEQRNRLLDMMG
ncbi:MAG: Hpt domain-containing protein [Pseudobutyrivibrio sp.]|nr:Hpt domain-containing protein [Pseudobutyrivibrio sp.]